MDSIAEEYLSPCNLYSASCHFESGVDESNLGRTLCLGHSFPLALLICVIKLVCSGDKYQGMKWKR